MQARARRAERRWSDCRAVNPVRVRIRGDADAETG